MPQEKALSTQVGGTHYKRFKIEPFPFSLVNHYDPAVFSILKYVSRHAFKSGAEDLKKAIHICYIRAEEAPTDYRVSARNKISIEDYIEQNGIPEEEASILRDLHLWARNDMAALTERQCADWIAGKIENLLVKTYGKESK